MNDDSVEKLELHKIVVDTVVDHMDMVHHDPDHALVGCLEHHNRVLEDEFDTVDLPNIVFLELLIDIWTVGEFRANFSDNVHDILAFLVLSAFFLLVVFIKGLDLYFIDLGFHLIFNIQAFFSVFILFSNFLQLFEAFLFQVINDICFLVVLAHFLIMFLDSFLNDFVLLVSLHNTVDLTVLGQPVGGAERVRRHVLLLFFTGLSQLLFNRVGHFVFGQKLVESDQKVIGIVLIKIDNGIVGFL